MKKIFLIVIFALFWQMVFPQNLKKVISFYEKGEYQKCIDKTEKLLEKYKKSAPLYYYNALSYFNLSKQTNSISKKKSYVYKSLIKTYRGLKYDEDRSHFEEFKGEFTELHDSVVSLSQRTYPKDKSYTEKLLKYLIFVFGDTTDIYREILAEQEKARERYKQQLAYKEYSGPINQTDEQGRKQGLWIEKYDDGTVKSEIFFVDGHPVGVYRRYYADGNKKTELVFDKSGKNAVAYFYNEDGSLFAKGKYVNQKKDSLWQYFYDDTIVFWEQHYKNGVLHGVERAYNIDRNHTLLMERFWKNGKEDSVYTSYYPWGQLKTIIHYKDGKKDGFYIYYNEDGTVFMKGYYKNDLKDSIWVVYDSPQDSSVIKYKNGELLTKEYEEKEQEKLDEFFSNPVDIYQIFKQETGIDPKQVYESY